MPPPSGEQWGDEYGMPHNMYDVCPYAMIVIVIVTVTVIVIVIVTVIVIVIVIWFSCPCAQSFSHKPGLHREGSLFSVTDHSNPGGRLSTGIRPPTNLG